MEPTANPVKYFNELLCMDIVFGTLLWIIVVIVVIILTVALLKFLFQLFFVIPVGTDYSADLLYAKEILFSSTAK
jgi:hypothetical protein